MRRRNKGRKMKWKERIAGRKAVAPTKSAPSSPESSFEEDTDFYAHIESQMNDSSMAIPRSVSLPSKMSITDMDMIGGSPLRPPKARHKAFDVGKAREPMKFQRPSTDLMGGQFASPSLKLIEGDWKCIIGWVLFTGVCASDYSLQCISYLCYSFRLMVSPKELFRYLVDIYETPLHYIRFDINVDKDRLRKQVIHFIVFWSESCFHDFHADEELEASLVIFLELVMTEHTLSKMKAQFQAHADPPMERQFCTAPITMEKAGDFERISDSADALLDDFTVEEIASALLYLDTEMYLRLEPEMMAAEKNGFSQFSARFNQISFGISTMLLLSCTSVDEQVRLMKRFLEIAAYLYNNENYNAMASIMSGIASHDITRLKYLFAELNDDKFNTTFHQLEPLITGEQNYAQLRLLERTGALVVPFIPMHLRDLTVLLENRKGTSESGLFNLDELLSIGECMFSLMHFRPAVVEKNRVNKAILQKPPFLPLQLTAKDALEDISDSWKEKYAALDTPVQISVDEKAIRRRSSMLKDKGKRLESPLSPRKQILRRSPSQLPHMHRSGK